LLSFLVFIGRFLSTVYEPPLPGTALLDTCPTDTRDAIGSELDAIKEIAATGIAYSCQNTNRTTWELWTDFCAALLCDPALESIDDPIPYLQIFAHRYRTGAVAPSRTNVRSQTVEGALHAVGQVLASLGSPDPRLTANGKLDLRLTQQLSAYKKQDPPPSRVKPVPFPIIAQTVSFCHTANTPASNTMANMLLLGFFFLLRPGEYAYRDNSDALRCSTLSAMQHPSIITQPPRSPID